MSHGFHKFACHFSNGNACHYSNIGTRQGCFSTLLHPFETKCHSPTWHRMNFRSKEFHSSFQHRKPGQNQGSRRTMLSKALHPIKAPPLISTFEAILMLTKELHPAKARYPMLLTESGMLMFFRELHPLNALSGMLVTESGIAMLSKDLHSAKARYPVLVTESGMLMFFREHPLKALSPMLVTESGMLMFFRELHPLKALCPMLVTESGMLMFSKELHSAKAKSPMQVHPVKVISSLDVLEWGMTTFTSSWHPRKASSEIFVTSWGIITPKKPGEFTSFLDAASISLLVYITLTSGSASKPTSFSVWASSSKQLPWNTATLQIFCSIGSSQENWSRSLAFSCCTVWISVTSRARTSPRKVLTFSWGMATNGSNWQARSKRNLLQIACCMQNQSRMKNRFVPLVFLDSLPEQYPVASIMFHSQATLGRLKSDWAKASDC